MSICLVQICDDNWLLRQWLAICLGQLWQNFAKARWSGVRDLAHEKLYPLLQDPVPEVRAAAVFALGTYISSVTERSEHANIIDRFIAMTLLSTVGEDMSPLVRHELVTALQWMVILFESHFVSVYLQESTISTSIGCSSQTTHSLERNINMKRVFSSSSIPNMSTGNFTTSAIGFGSIYVKLWQGIVNLGKDPYPKVAEAAQKLIEYVRNQAVCLIAAKEATNDKYGSSLSLPPSPNTRSNYLGESPPPSTSTHHLHHHHHPLNNNMPASSTVMCCTSNSGGSGKRSSLNTITRIGGIVRCTTPTGPVINVRNSYGATTNPEDPRSTTPPMQQQKLRSGSMHDETDGGFSSPPQNIGGGSSVTATNDQNFQQPMKPLVTTNFIPWSISYFARSSRSRERDNGQYLLDKHSPEYRARRWRFERNEYIRRVAREQQLRAIFHRIDTQNWIGKTQFTPSIVKLLPYEQQIAVAYKEKVSVHDWSKGTVYSYIPQQTSTVNNVIFMSGSLTSSTKKQTTVSPSSLSSRVTALEFINAHDIPLILVGYEDGMIRIWEEVVTKSLSSSSSNGETRLVTAWQGLPVSTKISRGMYSVILSKFKIIFLENEN